MKLNKGQGISICLALVSFVVFSVVLFVLPINRTITFWMAYAFCGYAFVVTLVSILIFFSKTVKEERFLNTPVVVVTWLYFIGQLYLSYRELLVLYLPYFVTYSINLVIALVLTSIIIILSVAAGRINKGVQYTQGKLGYIETLKNELYGLETEDDVVQNKVNILVEEVTYSDPMSNSQLVPIETELLEVIKSISESADTNEKTKLCDKALALLKKRNNECRSLKKIAQKNVIQTDEKGKNYILIGFIVALVIIAITIIVVFYIVPETSYKNACQLMSEEQYDDALKKFENLDEYKDSKEKISEIEELILEKEYSEALTLMNEKDFDASILAFEKLGDYKDSAEKINEIKNIVIDESYRKAEAAFEAGNYSEALDLYVQISPYKDSSEKIINIMNRESSDSIMYLGIYESKPIAWRIIEMQGYNQMTLLADEPIRNLPISDEISNTRFEDSDLAVWLNNDFIEQFTEADIDKIIENNGLKVSLLSDEEVKKLDEQDIDISCNSEWWIKTESGSGFKYVTAEGDIKDAGDIHLRDKGVRPIIVINIR